MGAVMVIKRSSGINVLTWDEVMELFRDSEEYQKAKHPYLSSDSLYSESHAIPRSILNHLC